MIMMTQQIQQFMTIPTDNATNDIDENIEITFSEDKDVEEGIIIYKSNGDVVETIDVTSAQAQNRYFNYHH